MISTFYRTPPEAGSFSDAEGGKDQVQDVVRSGLAGEGVEGPERAIEIEQDHLVGNAAVVGLPGVSQGGESRRNGLVLAEIGEHAGFGGGSAGGQGQDFFA